MRFQGKENQEIHRDRRENEFWPRKNKESAKKPHFIFALSPFFARPTLVRSPISMDCCFFFPKNAQERLLRRLFNNRYVPLNNLIPSFMAVLSLQGQHCPYIISCISSVDSSPNFFFKSTVFCRRYLASRKTFYGERHLPH